MESAMPECSVDGCSRKTHSKGFCASHYKRWSRHGDPLKGPVSRGVPMEFFLSALNSTTEECIAWPYAKRGLGRGAIQWQGKTQKVHRVMCEQAHGHPPTTKHHAAHECGNGHLGCINPRHLAWKTASENEADKIRHGTEPKQRQPKFSVGQIKFMRETMTVVQIADALHCSNVTVYNYLKKP